MYLNSSKCLCLYLKKGMSVHLSLCVCVCVLVSVHIYEHQHINVLCTDHMLSHHSPYIGVCTKPLLSGVAVKEVLLTSWLAVSSRLVGGVALASPNKQYINHMPLNLHGVIALSLTLHSHIVSTLTEYINGLNETISTSDNNITQCTMHINVNK